MTANRRRIRLLLAPVTLVLAQPLHAQNDGSAAVFALIDKNEWCPGGSVYVDLQTGSFMLYPRLDRPACKEAKMQTAVEQGKLSAAPLQDLRSAYGEARRAGLQRKVCDLVVSNGGPEALVMTGSAFAATAHPNEGCWSEEAQALHNKLFTLFGEQRRRRQKANTRTR